MAGKGNLFIKKRGPLKYHPVQFSLAIIMTSNNNDRKRNYDMNHVETGSRRTSSCYSNVLLPG